jgi:hypothetical protein
MRREFEDSRAPVGTARKTAVQGLARASARDPGEVRKRRVISRIHAGIKRVDDMDGRHVAGIERTL